eukprot:TRINITY_DN4049_c0_g1_i3.p1 TRINITY_DN4049_c0_g1~~TRINITY_DN4049_c0_g1_i3.p1  ORF type:complete len:534 (-),score=41.62 TRINITY_DN4049_c0_g1_i3:35-1411(-)
MQILEAHTDIVRCLLKIDEFRLVSASDEGRVVVWNHVTGQCIHTIQAHTRPVTCMLLLDRHTLLTGSSDRSIRFWNIATGACEHVLHDAHKGSVQCLAKLQTGEGRGVFCSGGNDQDLCLWKAPAATGSLSKPSLLGLIHRKEEENLHCLLPISGQRIVTASNASYLFVYNTDTMAFDKLLAYHRESVRCLINISESMFASGSLDGSVVIWQTDTLAPLKILDYPEKFFDNHAYPFAVSHMVTLIDKYLCCAMGRGFRIYDVTSGECVLDNKDAHEAQISQVMQLYKGTRLVTCSADSSIKIWSVSPSGLQRRGVRFGRSTRTAQQVGEMWGHSEAVVCLLPFSSDSFASCGADGLVILWKDGRGQWEMRNRYATAALLQHHMQLDAEQLDEVGDVDDVEHVEPPPPNPSPVDGQVISVYSGTPTRPDISHLQVQASADCTTQEVQPRSERNIQALLL